MYKYPQEFVEESFSDSSDYYLGKILTIIDASIPGVQGKAIKDLVKHEIYALLQDNFNNCRHIIGSVINSCEKGKDTNVEIKLDRKDRIQPSFTQPDLESR